MKRKVLSLLLLALPLLLSAQMGAIFNGVNMLDSLEGSAEKLKSISKNIHTISIGTPAFPLAKKQEVHLVCEGVNTPAGVLERAVFTFGDGALKHVQAHGNTWEVFTGERKDTAMTYMDYTVYFSDKLVLDKGEDMAWILSDGGMHANLFTWQNPFLMNPEKTGYGPAANDKIPGFITMGNTYEALKDGMERNSLFTQREELDGTDPNAQFQVNCFGVDYLGFPRKVEARFGDDKLNVVWILTGKEEEERVRKSLVSQFGEPVFVNDDWEIYNNWQVGLRKDKPEVLLMEQEIGLQYKSSYFKQ